MVKDFYTADNFGAAGFAKKFSLVFAATKIMRPAVMSPEHTARATGQGSIAGNDAAPLASITRVARAD